MSIAPPLALVVSLIAFGCQAAAPSNGSAARAERPVMISVAASDPVEHPQDEFHPRELQSRRSVSVPIGVGFTADPGTFLTTLAVDFPSGDNLAWGPAVQFGVGRDRTLIAPYLQGKYIFGDLDSAEKTIRPFLQAGVGFVYLDETSRSGDSSILVNGGGGLRFDLEGDTKLASTILWNWAPGGIGTENAYLSWEVIQLIIPF